MRKHPPTASLCALIAAVATVSTAAAKSAPKIAAGPPPQQQKHNVLYVISDDLRPELTSFGQKQMKTPNLDKLAATGTVFLKNYVQQVRMLEIHMNFRS